MIQRISLGHPQLNKWSFEFIVKLLRVLSYCVECSPLSLLSSLLTSWWRWHEVTWSCGDCRVYKEASSGGLSVSCWVRTMPAAPASPWACCSSSSPLSSLSPSPSLLYSWERSDDFSTFKICSELGDMLTLGHSSSILLLSKKLRWWNPSPT